MCGIAGWFGTITLRAGCAVRMVRALGHRGPDAHRIKAWPRATLAHTRLSIIDLSPAGEQPISNEDGTVWVIFNGEIYNHRELRRYLEARGHTFKGRSDAEVLPHLYEQDGCGLLTKLRGMFAFAIYDLRAQTLLLARDRFGIKPLFYSCDKHRLTFASEIRALLQVPGIDDTPDRQAIYDFAALLFIPSPETFFRGIRSLKPGEFIEASLADSGLSYKTGTYHKWTIAPNLELTLAQAKVGAENLLTSAVRRQMESDVSLGALLSGGIDSSLVSAAAQAGLQAQLRTFNVQFGDQEYDETPAALAVARHIGSFHETIPMEENPGSWDYITELLQHAGQPFADTSIFAANLVCRLMRNHVKVALSGDGGDEAFGGYALYRRIARITRGQMLPRWFWDGASRALAALEWLPIVPDRLPQHINGLTGADDTAIIQNLLSWVREEEHRRLCLDSDVLPVRRLFEPQWEYFFPKSASRLERLSAQATEIYTRLLMPNDFLFKVDTASMRESLEVRVPMLDEELFAFGLSLPHRLKTSGGKCKQVLRAVAKAWLPAGIASKPKRGFGVPVDRWVNADFKLKLKESLLSPSSSLPEFFRPETYRPMVESFCEGRACAGISRQGLYQRAIMLLSLHLALSRRN